MKFGTVVITEFPGAVVTKRRPAVVVSGDRYNQERPDVILAIVTSQVQSATASMDYILSDLNAAGLSKSSAVRMFLVTTPKSRVTKIGELSADDSSEVSKRLQIAFEN